MAQAPSLSTAGLAAASELLEDARRGLLTRGQKTLPCKYLYDAAGSLLFEAICALPEYGLAGADTRLLRRHAREMVAPFPPGVMVAELGSGSARKTRWLLQALCRPVSLKLRRASRQPTRYWPVEISLRALERSGRELAELRGLEVEPIAADYLDGLAAIACRRRQLRFRHRPLLVLFLGSTLGNFEPPAAAAFLRSLRDWLQPGDGLLLGLDLVKPAARLRLAYDDPAGVTAAFNKNLLARLNRELGMDFDLREWQHRALYRPRERRVEMHLRARRALYVRFPSGETAAFARGETIWTESSHKFRLRDIAELLATAGFHLIAQWQDGDWPFAESLALVD